jgi:hypothetical protein
VAWAFVAQILRLHAGTACLVCKDAALGWRFRNRNAAPIWLHHIMMIGEFRTAAMPFGALFRACEDST